MNMHEMIRDINTAVKSKNAASGKGTLFIVSSKDFRHGTGRSTIKKFIEKNVENTIGFSTGDIFRQMAKEHGMPIGEFVKHAETHPELDKELDTIAKQTVEKVLKMTPNEFIEYAEESPYFNEETVKKAKQTLKEGSNINVAVDSNILAHFVPDGVNLFVDVNDNVRSERVMKGQRVGDAKYSSAQEALNDLLERDASDRQRYKDLYQIDPESFAKKFPITVDNSGSMEETEKQTIKLLHSHLTGDKQ